MTDRKRLLGLDRSITRRDFVNVNDVAKVPTVLREAQTVGFHSINQSIHGRGRLSPKSKCFAKNVEHCDARGNNNYGTGNDRNKK